MTSDQLRVLAAEYLVPFFTGTQIEGDPVASNSQQACVAFVDPCAIAFKINRLDPERLLLRRSQPFAGAHAGVVSEMDVVNAFVDVVRSVEPGLSQPYREDLLESLNRRVVGKSIAAEPFESVLLKTLDQMDRWSSRLYEGHPITAAIGFIPDDDTQTVVVMDAWKRDFTAVLTNGHDTLFTANHNGHILGHEALRMPVQPPSYAPYRLGPVADWAQKGRVAVVLNRVGEIMILRDNGLIFARRSGSWHFVIPGPLLTQMAGPDNPEVRRAVLETAIDVSFARTGGCIGIVTSTHRRQWKTVVVHPDDYLEPATSVKAQVLAQAVAGRKFQELDRRLRQELVAIDGATVIDHNGRLLAIGAILQIPGGSEGGGRLAAAKALAALGVGLKISQDGGIRCYHDDRITPTFSLM